MKKVSLFWFSIIIIFLSGFWANSVSAQNNPDLDEYSVFSALLQQEFIGKGTKQLVIKNQTDIYNFSNNETLDNLQKYLLPLEKETFLDFSSRNKQSADLKNKFNLKVKINLVGEEIGRIFAGGERDSENDGWKMFHKKYPTAGGFITLSRVGFNKEKTQALIYAAHNCGWLCGEGNYILLVKKDNIWKIEEKLMNWIS
jgi:hypothetical protein